MVSLLVFLHKLMDCYSVPPCLGEQGSGSIHMDAVAGIEIAFHRVHQPIELQKTEKLLVLARDVAVGLNEEHRAHPVQSLKGEKLCRGTS
jgi:hypothetical protein